MLVTPGYESKYYLKFRSSIRIFVQKFIRKIGAEMDTKLTLKLNKRSIERAKKYAKKNKQSLSSMVENYFNMISDKDPVNDLEITPNVLELSGIIKLSGNFNLKQMYGKHLEDKYTK